MSEQEFSRRVRACTGRLWRISYSILRNGADCDDALQEALLRAWRGIRSLKQPEFFDTWLTRILINECRRVLRRRGNQPQALPEALAEEEAPSSNPVLRDAILALPVPLRVPLVLHYLEGYTIKEVSQMLNLPVTTVNWRLHSARKQIRDEWK
ncbi:MAG: RNA polymerase sigma factor [Clostridia bacterium]|nr:RNA polymerase sigma factor [Clostridia bacterium]